MLQIKQTEHINQEISNFDGCDLCNKNVNDNTNDNDFNAYL